MKIFYTQKSLQSIQATFTQIFSIRLKTEQNTQTTFHLDITPKSLKKASNVYSDILIRLKKMHKNRGS